MPRSRTRSSGSWLLASGFWLLAVGCPTEKPAPAPQAPPPATAPKLEGTVRVLAAASLAGPFSELGAAFEKKFPGVKVELSFGSSTAHERQIEAGAPCDLYVAAARANVERLASLSLVESATVVARNTLVLIVPRGDLVPADLESISVYPRVAVGAKGVPVGDYARPLLAGIVPDDKLAGYPDEPSIVTAVAQGAVPAGVCYASSLLSHPRHDAVQKALGIESKTPIVYPAVLVKGTKVPELARAFESFVRSPEGRAVLMTHGFQGE